MSDSSSSPTTSEQKEVLCLREVVERINDACSTTPINYEKIRDTLACYDATLNEWRRFEHWDDKKRYTRNLVATDNTNYALMLLCWNPNRASMVHSHAGSQCYVRTICGTIVERKYAMPTTNVSELEQLNEGQQVTMTQLSETTYPAGVVSFINDTIALHSLSNDYAEPSVTLHCYMPPYSSSHCFDDEGKHHVSHMTYDTEHGESTQQ